MICIAMWCVVGALAIDGDTFKARGAWGMQSFRLEGIQAPERGQPGYHESKWVLQNLIEDDLLSCDTSGYPTWNRQEVRCTTSEGVDLSCEMIRQGRVVIWEEYAGTTLDHCRPPVGESE